MAKIILNAAVSLDGFIEDSNGNFDWCFTDQDYGMTQFLAETEMIFYGRKSYELMIEMKNEMFSKFDNYVFSQSEIRLESNWKLVNGDMITEVNKLKAQCQ